MPSETTRNPYYEGADPAIVRPTPVYKKWWLWTLVGGVLAVGAGAGIGIAYALPNDAALPARAALGIPVNF